MNAKAKALGMTTYIMLNRRAVDHNVSTARDLTKLLIASKQYPLIGQLSTTRRDGDLCPPGLYAAVPQY
jgi:D-alanyl-D-alanine endopeptidase (penicillin-binding protein 7)